MFHDLGHRKANSIVFEEEKLVWYATGMFMEFYMRFLRTELQFSNCQSTLKINVLSKIVTYQIHSWSSGSKAIEI